MAKARRQAPLLLYCAGRSRRVPSARGGEIPPLLTLFLWPQVGGCRCNIVYSYMRALREQTGEGGRGGSLSLLGHVALISYHGVEVMSVSKVRYTT